MAAMEERKIPVFSVCKNNAILKNIFLLNAPPTLNETLEDPDCQTHQEIEETLLVGRHPDCDIRLDHPSISRFHLRIHSKPSSTWLAVTDLSSVHGTWVSGRRIEPKTQTELNEGDVLKVGGSSRIYKLHWIPLNQAYDLDNPFVPPMDASTGEEDEAKEIDKDENFAASENDQMGSASVELESLPFDENSESFMQKENSSEAMEQENTLVNQNEDVQLQDSVIEGLEFLFLGSEFFMPKEIPQASNTENCSGMTFKDEMTCASERFESLVMEDCKMDTGEMDVPGLESLNLDETSEALIQEQIPKTVILNDEETQLAGSDLEGLESSFLQEYEVDSQEMDVPRLESFCLDETCEACVSEEIPTVLQAEQDNVPMILKDEDAILESLGSLFLEECEASSREMDVLGLETLSLDEPSEVLVPNEVHVVREEQTENSVFEDTKSTDSVFEGLEPLFLNQNSEPSNSLHEMGGTTANEIQGSEFIAEIISRTENMNPQERESERNFGWNFWSGSLAEASRNLSTPARGSLLETESNLLDKESMSPQLKLHAFSARRHMETVNEFQDDREEKRLWSFWTNKMEVESICSSLSDQEFVSELENHKLSNHLYQSPEPISSAMKLVKRSILESPPMSGKESISNIWSRRGKTESAPQIRTQNKENFKDEPVSRALFQGMDSGDQQEEIFTPDKENFTPNTVKSMRKKAMLRDVKPLNLEKSPVMNTSSMSATSDKENLTPRAILVQKSLKAQQGQRVPFQPLFTYSSQKSVSDVCASDATMIGHSVKPAKAISKNKNVGERVRRWDMVVDATTLLNKESRKALQLLEGLKGTQLIIPRIVIRELDCIRKQTSFFRRNTDVSLALEWIEQCMIRAPWWIHIQTSIEEGRPVAPTPPATPQSQLSGGCSFAFGTLPEIISPTSEDHVLDYALFCRRNGSDGQLVLLSNDVALKIKAMAEGLICETTEEFRESLVNPFSERFLWAHSSPRGQTWSYMDDVVLRQTFYPSSVKMTPKGSESAKGLKLILLHNSQYQQRVSSVR